jgi:hypothetical protein
MRPTEIHLSEPFNEILASLLALPCTHAEADGPHSPNIIDSRFGKRARSDAEVKDALRCLYEAAHGRQVETPIGFVAIAPPVAGFLKETPYYVATQCEFFLEAFARLLAGDKSRKGRTTGSEKPDGKRATERCVGAHPTVTREQRALTVP